MPLLRSWLRNPATFSIFHNTDTVDYSAIAALRSQSHHLSIDGGKGRLGQLRADGLNIPDLYRAITRGNVARWAHDPILPVQDNSVRGRLDP